MPFVIERRDDRVIVQIHLTAKNPLVELADGIRRFLLIVSGDDAYISNDWYVSRDNVSTWLYEAVHLSGVAHLRKHAENRGHGDALLAVSEARLPKQPWDLTQMEPGKREAMLAGIRVIDLVVDEIEGQSKLNQHKSDADYVALVNRLAQAEETTSLEGQSKLNQHKSDADYVALVNRLAQAEETTSRRLAEKMRALRPGLAYDEEIAAGQRAVR